MYCGYSNNLAFNGTTKVYAMSDTHQETRSTAVFLSKILDNSQNENNKTLMVHGGDIYKGIYPKDMECDAYIKMKEANPDIEMVMTVGNNDFGFNQDSLNYLIGTIKKFADKGIKVVCSNIFDSNGNRPEWLEPYTVVERDGDRTFVTGFCIDNINTAKSGIFPKKQEMVVDELAEAIKREKPDNVMILNHDYMPSSQSIVDQFAEKGINVDVTIGGHDHVPVKPDLDKHIYYPEAFGKTMCEIDLVNNDGEKTITNHVYKNKKSTDDKINQIFLDTIKTFEKETNLYENMAPCVLNLPKKYSGPSQLGTFLADEMKKSADTDIAFFSTGFATGSLYYAPNTYITKYKLKKAVTGENPIKKVELTSAELADVFQHALAPKGFSANNPKFLQCSNNVVIEGSANQEENRWELKQLYIDGEALFDSEMKPLNPDKKYSCAIDSYIADGGQGFKTLQDAEKQDVMVNGEPLRINEVLANGLVDAAKKYAPGYDYPAFEINEV